MLRPRRDLRLQGNSLDQLRIAAAWKAVLRTSVPLPDAYRHTVRGFRSHVTHDGRRARCASLLSPDPVLGIRTIRKGMRHLAYDCPGIVFPESLGGSSGF